MFQPITVTSFFPLAQVIPSLGNGHPLEWMLCMTVYKSPTLRDPQIPHLLSFCPQKSLIASSLWGTTGSPKLTCAFPDPDPNSTISLESHSYF